MIPNEPTSRMMEHISNKLEQPSQVVFKVNKQGLKLTAGNTIQFEEAPVVRNPLQAVINRVSDNRTVLSYLRLSKDDFYFTKTSQHHFYYHFATSLKKCGTAEGIRDELSAIYWTFVSVQLISEESLLIGLLLRASVTCHLDL